MNNKKFLIVSVGLAFVSLIALRYFNDDQQNNESKLPTVSTDILIKFHSPVKGDVNAPVTVVEFLDPECEACRAMHPILKNLLEEYQGKVRLVIRYMPLHKNSLYAAAALEEARVHGKYEEAVDTLFENQPTWGDHQRPRPDLIPTYLVNLGIPKDGLTSEVVLSKHQSKIEIDREDAQKAGVTGTPTFFVNGVKLDRIGYEPIKKAIDRALEEVK